METLDIDKKTTALVIIDLQKGIAAMGRQLAPHSMETVLGNAGSLAEAFRKNKMQVFLVHVVMSAGLALNPIADEQNKWNMDNLPADWADFVPQLKASESDIIINKRQWGAFYGTDLELHLRRMGIKTIVLCGVSTTHGVESTARFAYEYGFQQIFAEDAMSSMSKEMHEASINGCFKRIGRIRKTSEILENL